MLLKLIFYRLACTCRPWPHLIRVYICLSSGGEEDETDGYEIIETPGSRHLVEQLITMDLAERPAVQQITIGGMSGWYVNTGVYRQDGIFP